MVRYRLGSQKRAVVCTYCIHALSTDWSHEEDHVTAEPNRRHPRHTVFNYIFETLLFVLKKLQT